MAAVRYYLDEHIAGAVATGLRNRGIDVLTLSEAGMLGVSDREHFTYAREDGRVLVTHDDDFLRLADQTEEHAGVAFAIGEIDRGTGSRTYVDRGGNGRRRDGGHVEFF